VKESRIVRVAYQCIHALQNAPLEPMRPPHARPQRTECAPSAQLRHIVWEGHRQRSARQRAPVAHLSRHPVHKHPIEFVPSARQIHSAWVNRADAPQNAHLDIMRPHSARRLRIGCVPHAQSRHFALTGSAQRRAPRNARQESMNQRHAQTQATGYVQHVRQTATVWGARALAHRHASLAPTRQSHAQPQRIESAPVVQAKSTASD